MTSHHLRTATLADRDFVVELAGRAFAQLGDYAAMMGGWFDHPEVGGTIVEVDGISVGFALWAFMTLRPDDLVCLDVIAVAVEPELRCLGFGRALLRRALADARPAAKRLGATHASLSVDPANEAARGLFVSEGFCDSEQAPTSYPAGQRATRMVRPLDDDPKLMESA